MDQFQNFRSSTLWPTTVRHGTVYRAPSFNADLTNVVEDYYQANKRKTVDGLNAQGQVVNVLETYKHTPAVSKFFDMIDLLFWDYAINTLAIQKERISNVQYLTVGARERTPEWTLPHNHAGAQVVITYYPRVIKHKDEPHPHAGDLVFHPETNMQFRYWAQASTTFFPVKTESGLLIIFPAHALHSTFPLFHPDSVKYALTTNVQFDIDNTFGPGSSAPYVKHTQGDRCEV